MNRDEQIKHLIKIVKAQRELLVCYRIGTQPKGKTLDFLATIKEVDLEPCLDSMVRWGKRK